jgi:Na+-transporting NADH:ubiquinone oxidoreductase subunit NqrE
MEHYINLFIQAAFIDNMALSLHVYLSGRI